MNTNEICEVCGGIKDAPDHVSLVLFCDCPFFPAPKEFDPFDYEEFEEDTGCLPETK